MKKLYTSIFLMLLLTAAPKLWAQVSEIPDRACLTPEFERCASVSTDTVQKWSEGTEAWPDEACNPGESFGDCDTNNCDSANSYAQYVCELNGYDVGIWTGNKLAGCGPGGPGGPVTNGTGQFSIYCQDNSIPCDPFFESECAPTDQTQIEVICCTFSRGQAAPIPAMSEIGLIVMAAFLGIAGYAVYRRRERQARDTR